MRNTGTISPLLQVYLQLIQWGREAQTKNEGQRRQPLALKCMTTSTDCTQPHYSTDALAPQLAAVDDAAGREE